MSDDIPQEEDIPVESEVDVDEAKEWEDLEGEDLPVEEEFDKDEYVEPKDEEDKSSTKASSKQKAEVSSVQQGESDAA